MPNSSYEILIYNHDGKVIRQIPRTSDLKLSLIRNDMGIISSALVGEDAEWAFENLNLQQHESLNYIMVVRRANFDSRQPVQLGAFFLRRFNPWINEQGQKLYSLGGVSPEWLLSQRILIPEQDPRYEDKGVRYITEAGVTSQLIGELVSYHLGSYAKLSRRYEDISVVYHGEVGQGGGRWDSDKLIDVIKELAASDGVDFAMEYVPDSNEFLFHVGNVYRDRRVENTEGNMPYILAERLGNLYQPSLSFDYMEEQNVLWIRQDEDEETEPRRWVRLQSETANIPYNVNEFELNNTRKDETETASKLITDGKALLKENEPSVEIEIEFNDQFRNRFQVDWNLGDKITVEFANHIFDFQISEVEINVSGQQETISPKITKIDRLVKEEEEESP